MKTLKATFIINQHIATSHLQTQVLVLSLAIRQRNIVERASALETSVCLVLPSSIAPPVDSTRWENPSARNMAADIREYSASLRLYLTHLVLCILDDAFC